MYDVKGFLEYRGIQIETGKSKGMDI